MNKVTKTAIVGLLALFAGNAAATDGEIVFDGEILKSACDDRLRKTVVAHVFGERTMATLERLLSLLSAFEVVV